VIVLGAVVGCRQILGLNDLHDGKTADALADAPLADAIPDAIPCASLTSQCVGDTLRTCKTVGSLPTDTPCAWGCSSASTPRCLQLVPSGGGVVPADLDPDPTLAAVTLLGATTIDANTGAISGIRPPGPDVINGVGYTVRGNVAVFRFASLTVNGPVTLIGTKPIALVAIGDITIANIVDARGGCLTVAGGPGGFPGGIPASPAGGSGGGGVAVQGAASASGAGGGGHGVAAGSGGIGTTDPVAGGAAGAAFGDDTITVLLGGGGGGGGLSGTAGGPGGGGGGAVQLAANGSIAINSGGINAGGCGGHHHGAGGGAGGTILLEAVQVAIATGAAIAVNGGGGGGGGVASGGATDGAMASLDTARALGGAGSTISPVGGAGGLGGASGAVGGDNGTNNVDGGGGGGAVGRMRINTRAGAASIAAGAVLSPSLSEAKTTTTQGVAVTQ
jgi:hypothetical protein